MLDLETHIARLLDSVAQRHPIPPWREQRVLDTSDPRVRWVSGEHPGWRVHEDALQPVAAFSDRFDQLLRSGYAWVNLSVYGIAGETLVFGIELPATPTGVPTGRTSVNYSGPSRDTRTGSPQWALALVLEGVPS